MTGPGFPPTVSQTSNWSSPTIGMEDLFRICTDDGGPEYLQVVRGLIDISHLAHQG